MSPMETSDFKRLSKASKGPMNMGKKVDWALVRAFLSNNKHLAYKVGEVMEYTIANCLVNEATSISRVRVYKELQKMVKKDQVEVGYDEAGVGLYMWRHIKKEQTQPVQKIKNTPTTSPTPKNTKSPSERRKSRRRRD